MDLINITVQICSTLVLLNITERFIKLLLHTLSERNMSEEDVKALLSENNLTTSEIAKKLKVSRNTAIRLLDVMRVKGLVDYRPVGPAKLWYLKPTTEEEKAKIQEKIHKAIKSTCDESKNVFSAPTVELLERTLLEMEKEMRKKRK